MDPNYLRLQTGVKDVRPISDIAPYLFQKGVCSKVVQKIFALCEINELSNMMTVSKYWNQELWRAFAIKLINTNDLPVFNYKNLLRLNIDLKEKLKAEKEGSLSNKTAKLDVSKISKMNFIALSKLEGIMQFSFLSENQKQEGPVRYYRLPKDKLKAFLTLNCGNENEWNSLVSDLAQKIRENLSLAEIIIGYNQISFNNWQEAPKEKKDNWVKACSIKDLFFLPSSLAKKIAAEGGAVIADPQAMVVQWDNSVCSQETLNIIHQEEIHKNKANTKYSECIRVVLEICDSIKLTPFKLNGKFLPRTFQVTYNHALRDKFLKLLEKNNFNGRVVLNVAQDFIPTSKKDMIKRFILPEFYEGRTANPNDACVIIL